MQFNANDPRVVVTSGGTFCLFDEDGRLIGTITRPVRREPLGAGRETVFLARADVPKASAA